VLSRAAHSKAILGNDYEFRSLSEQVTRLFEESKILGGGPEYLYWFDATMAKTVVGQSMLLLALQSKRNSGVHLHEAEQLLTAEIVQIGVDRPRDAVYYGAWLG